MYKRTTLDYVFLFIKGIFMGAANKVPGVSGGIIALVTGFYEELIYSFQKINSKALLLLRKKRFKSFFEYINFKFLLAVNAGSVFSFFSVSLLLDFLIRNYEVMVWSFFFGMILGSIYYIAKDVKQWDYKTLIPLILGLALGVFISFSDPLTENRNLFFIFLCGIISVSGMTLPGLSGSFILILLGNYTLLLVRSVNVLFAVIKQTFTRDFSYLDDEESVQILSILATFGIGSVAGLVSFSHALGFLLKRYRNQVLTTLIGFIAGSLGAVWPWKKALNKNGEEIPKDQYAEIDTYVRFWPEINSQLFLAILFLIIGILVILTIDYFEKKRVKTPI